MTNFYLQKMNELNADGIDFIDFLDFVNNNPSIIVSYSKNEFEKEKYIPKTCYKYWKLIDGKKVYIE